MKKVYTDGLKSIEKKNFAAMFSDITRKRILPEDLQKGRQTMCNLRT